MGKTWLEKQWKCLKKIWEKRYWYDDWMMELDGDCYVIWFDPRIFYACWRLLVCTFQGESMTLWNNNTWGFPNRMGGSDLANTKIQRQKATESLLGSTISLWAKHHTLTSSISLKRLGRKGKLFCIIDELFNLITLKLVGNEVLVMDNGKMLPGSFHPKLLETKVADLFSRWSWIIPIYVISLLHIIKSITHYIRFLPLPNLWS